jgi:hypothetical protein
MKAIAASFIEPHLNKIIISPSNESRRTQNCHVAQALNADELHKPELSPQVIGWT